MCKHFLIRHLARFGEAKPLFGIVDKLMLRNEHLLAMLPGEWDLMFRGPSWCQPMLWNDQVNVSSGTGLARRLKDLSIAGGRSLTSS